MLSDRVWSSAGDAAAGLLDAEGPHRGGPRSSSSRGYRATNCVKEAGRGPQQRGHHSREWPVIRVSMPWTWVPRLGHSSG